MHRSNRSAPNLPATLTAVASVAAIALVPAGALAQAYPSKPVRLVQGFAAGGNADTIARVLAQGLTDELGQSFVVEGRTGAGGNIASEYVARAPADGYTLILETGGHAVSAAIYKKLSFDPLGDFKWLSLAALLTFVMSTAPDNKINNIADLISMAKANPGKLSFSSVGVGTTQHLIGELLQASAGIRLLHVPYRGGGAPVQDVIAGRVDLLFDTVTVTRGQVEGGKLRALGVTSKTGIAQLPGVPPVADTVRGFEVTSWAGLAGPAGLSPQVTERLHGAIVKVVAQPAVSKRLTELGATPITTTPEETTRYVGEQIAKWKRVVAQAKIPQQ